MDCLLEDVFAVADAKSFYKAKGGAFSKVESVLTELPCSVHVFAKFPIIGRMFIFFFQFFHSSPIQTETLLGTFLHFVS